MRMYRNLTLYLHCYFVTVTVPYSLGNYWISKSQISLGTTLFYVMTLYSSLGKCQYFRGNIFTVYGITRFFQNVNPCLSNYLLRLSRITVYCSHERMYLSLIIIFPCVMGHIYLQQQMTDTSLQQARITQQLDKLTTRELTLQITVLVCNST
jgi:hypothetical protein